MMIPGTAPRHPVCPTPDVPDWVLEDLEGGPGRWVSDEDGLEERRAGEGRRILLSVRRPRALDLSADEFRAASYRAYCRLARRVVENDVEPIRIWNFLPAILGPLGRQPHRYMVFNAGRFQAYERWLGNRERFGRRIATATGVGHFGEDLVIHCLAADRPGRAVENPRQVAAYRYSERFGPLPPCFSRATLVDEPSGRRLLVGGTASVLGEDSCHAEDLEAQVRETLANLAAVVRTARLGPDAEPPVPSSPDEREELSRYRSVRVYHVRGGDAEELRRSLAARFPASIDLEMIQADLCRPELLVEIEGVADLDGGQRLRALERLSGD